MSGYASYDSPPGVVAQETFVPDGLIAGDTIVHTARIEIASGQNLPRGALIGRETVATPTVAAGGSNTGNGTVTGVSGPGVAPGTYAVTAISAAEFTVTGPNSTEMPNATVGQPYLFTGLGFDLNAGSTPFVAGDTFTITVGAASGLCKLCTSAATDGSQNPYGILIDAVNASAGNAPGGAYLTGDFNVNAMTFGTGVTPASTIDALRALGIFLVYPAGLGDVV
jgi:hypothetical protein